MILEFLGILIGFGSILFLAFVTTKLVGKKTSRSMNGKYITVIDAISLGFDKHIYLIKVAEEFVLIASSGKSIEFLTSLKLEDYETSQAEDQGNTFHFKVFFEKYVQSFKSKKSGKQHGPNESGNEDAADLAERDMFRSNLKKLRSITVKTDGQIKNGGDDITNEKT